ncbi:hypothetical protein MWN34_02140 [Ancylobacter sp. 6x-1]|uniref:Uncharacterized protein n=1 Tax=Ancylobacter crimeensis TaxID=2579147 RepID=A0ABT0D6Y3_9HYPH|nr:hypothetical protein [Ancylobacter crimeensis]MCK0195704.1 hypothetical protein [Ancylobacter crimeensis]
MRGLDFSSWQSLLATLIGLALFTLISIGIRLAMMLTIQQRRERMNRQINERLRILIAAYKTLGGSFTGNLTVDPTHLRDLRLRPQVAEDTAAGQDLVPALSEGSERSRRIRDAVEAALSDIILLGTEEQVRLADTAVRDLIAGRRASTHDLVVSLRAFIREALDIGPIPADLELPPQGPSRPSGAGGKGGGEKAGSEKEGGRSGGGGGGGGGAMGMGAGAGMGAGLGGSLGGGHVKDTDDDAASGHHA